MPRIAFDLKIRALKSDKQQDFWDTKTPAFGIRVSPRSKTFIANRGGTRKTLGHYPAISLQEARRRFFALKALTDTGTPQISFQQARSEFLAQDRWKASSKKRITQLLCATSTGTNRSTASPPTMSQSRHSDSCSRRSHTRSRVHQNILQLVRAALPQTLTLHRPPALHTPHPANDCSQTTNLPRSGEPPKRWETMADTYNF